MVESCLTMSVIRLDDQSKADLAPLHPRSESHAVHLYLYPILAEGHHS